jgi:hypothetical protein
LQATERAFFCSYRSLAGDRDVDHLGGVPSAAFPRSFGTADFS